MGKLGTKTAKNTSRKQLENYVASGLAAFRRKEPADQKFMQRVARAHVLIPLLQEAARKGHSESFKFMMCWFLHFFSVKLPPSVITPWRIDLASPGAPKKLENERMCETWERDGRPKISNRYCLKLAREFLSAEHATGSRQKVLIDRVRMVLLRHQARGPEPPRPGTWFGREMVDREIRLVLWFSQIGNTATNPPS